MCADLLCKRSQVLYRGFLLPALQFVMPLTVAVPLSSFIFAIVHEGLRSVLPLTFLGGLWAMLYLKSRNLLVPIAVHAMWNARIFLEPLL